MKAVQIVVLFCALIGLSRCERSFTIDHVNNTFLMDGNPFQFLSGSFHYFRSVPETWQRKLRLMRASGLNTVDIYVHWALHNPKDGVYDWAGIADVEKFIEIATKEDLYVILRPGPYICAEIDNGGLPYWLETKYPGIKLRTSDSNYIREVEKWYSVLMPKFEKHLYGNGGKIITVQVENEYGAFKVCDKIYLNKLKEETEKYVKGNAILFTTDRPIDNELECGQIDGVFVTTDFGISTAEEVDKYFKRLREVQKTGPLVNSEFYTGWLTHWQEENARKSAYDLATTLRIMLDLKANVNFYMYFGGTNFGFWAGANDWGIGKYMADITSYDYDAPLDEAGDTTVKYDILKDAIAEYFEIPKLEVFEKIPKVKFDSINMRAIDCILSENGRNFLATRAREESKLLTFEELDQFSGFVLYETQLPKFTRDPSNLVIEDLRDRAQIFVDGKLIGILARENNVKSIPINAGSGTKLQILVENQGRINFEIADDVKGILGNVTLQQYDEPHYQEFKSWTITGYPFEHMDRITRMIELTTSNYTIEKSGRLSEGPVVFHGEISLTQLGDTYWDASNWGKGFIVINGFNLGRYWPLAGPQITTFIPKDLLKSGKNTFTIIELQRAPTDLKINFTDKPIFLN